MHECDKYAPWGTEKMKYKLTKRPTWMWAQLSENEHCASRGYTRVSFALAESTFNTNESPVCALRARDECDGVSEK